MNKIDYKGKVNSTFNSYIHGKAKCIEYKGVDEKKKHWFLMKFENTGNKELFHWNQIRTGKFRDSKLLKTIKAKNTQQKLKERNRLVKSYKNKCIIPVNLKTKNILAVDLATKSVGLAYSKKGEIVRWKTISSQNEDFRIRGVEIVGEIVDILKTGMIDMVILEDVYLGLNSSVLAMLSEVRGMLTYHIKDMWLDLFIIPPILWKNRIKDCPVGREEQKKFMMDKFFEYTGVEADSDDSADAYMMLRACLYMGVDECEKL